MKKIIKVITSAGFISIISIAISCFFNKECLDFIPGLFQYIYFGFMNYPFFFGVLISWFAAVISTGIVLVLVNRNIHKRNEVGVKFVRQSEKVLQIITLFVLLYLSIHLASKSLCTQIGVPIFGEPYAEIVTGYPNYNTVDLFKYFSPQDLFLSIFAILIVTLIFILPQFFHSLTTIRLPKFQRNIEAAWLYFILSFVLSAIAALILYFYPGFFSFLSIFNKTPVNGGEGRDIFILFGITFVISSIAFFFFLERTKVQRKEIKENFRDLFLFFCFMPAVMVASLVLSKNSLVEFPNLCGHIVVGVVLISGFFTFMTLTTISVSLNGKPYSIWSCLISASLALISLFSMIFLWIPVQNKTNFEKILSFAVAIMILILLYGFLYEKLQKYQFTEWWRRELRPIAMIISITVVVIVGAMDPKTNIWVLGMAIPTKLLWIIFALFFMYSLPWIVMAVKKHRKFLKRELPIKKLLPNSKGMLLVKTEIGLDKLIYVVKELNRIDGVCQPMVVRGEYDVCAIIEGVDSKEIDEKVVEIRNMIEGVTSTTTLIDISEFFDEEVKSNDKRSN